MSQPADQDNGERHVMVIGPNGQPVGMASLPDTAEQEEGQGVGSISSVLSMPSSSARNL